MTQKIKLTQIRSRIGSQKYHIASLRGLGLWKINSESVLENTPEIRVETPYFKPNKNLTDNKPDYFLYETDKWLVFPHELDGLTLDEIKKHKPELNDLIKKL